VSKQTFEEWEPLIKLFFGRARSLQNTSRKKFQAESKISRDMATQILPKSRWYELQDEWALNQIRVSMNEAYQASTYREQFTVQLIMRHLRQTGIGHLRFMRIAIEEWREQRMHLPTLQEKVLSCIKEMVARRIPPREMTHKLICQTVGVRFQPEPWFREAILSARRELLAYQTTTQIDRPPEGVNALYLPGGWVDMDSDVWNLRPGQGSCLKRNLLRSDIAEIGWPQMRKALLDDHLTCGTVSWHYLGYRWAGELLGSEVLDVRKATLERVQRAWLKYDAKPTKLEIARAALRRIFTHLCSADTESSEVNVSEMLLIAGWLYSSATVRFDSPSQDFLSDAEIDAIISGCLIDIKAGLDFTEDDPDLLSLSTRPSAGENASVVVNWASSLMLLLMLFTGLRSQSVLSLKIGDWAEIRPGLFALIWSHGKKREEKVAILATSVALLIDQYAQRTAKVRQALGTEKVFLVSNINGYWGTSQEDWHLRECLSLFTRRHGIKRGGIPLKLHSLILRRTYATRELYMGRSIWALRLQLGHEKLRTTRRYCKFDLFEHPAEVGSALNEYGRKSLTLWHYPLLLADLDDAERDRILGLKEERHQDVGLCRFDSCRKILSSNPAPCSLCEHLVTGPEFLGAWEQERRGREEEIEELRFIPHADHLLAQKKSQYDMFRVNLAYVKGEEPS
jgi:integrase